MDRDPVHYSTCSHLSFPEPFVKEAISFLMSDFDDFVMNQMDDLLIENRVFKLSTITILYMGSSHFCLLLFIL